MGGTKGLGEWSTILRWIRNVIFVKSHRIPFERAKALAEQFNIFNLIQPLLDYMPAPAPTVNHSLPPVASTSTLLGQVSQFPTPPPGRSTLTREADRKRERESGEMVPNLNQSVSKRLRTMMEESQDLNFYNNLPSTSTPPLRNNFGMVKPLSPPETFNFRLRPNSKPSQLFSSISDDPSGLDRQRGLLMSLFTETVPKNPLPSDLDPDLPLDETFHTALHWASALARLPLVEFLLDFGSDGNRGNLNGETPLIKSVLVTNNHDQDTFPVLIERLSPGLRTTDDQSRTVLHHIALMAAIKNRSPSSRYYMECILEFIARKEGGEFKALVDAQDVHGDTALNIAARVGNKALVRMLLDVGANKVLPNKLGLRPGDFGVDEDMLKISPGEESLANLIKTSSRSLPLPKSRDILDNLNLIIEQLNQDFSSEIQSKSDNLEGSRRDLKAVTKELADQRKIITESRRKVSELEETNQRIKNLQRALEEEDNFDWTGRSEIDGRPALNDAGPAFYRYPNAPTLSLLSPVQLTAAKPLDVIRENISDSRESLLRLGRIKLWYLRMDKLLQDRIKETEGAGADLEARTRRVVAYCCGVPVDQVDGMLEQLIIAMESDGVKLDMSRVATFMVRLLFLLFRVAFVLKYRLTDQNQRGLTREQV